MHANSARQVGSFAVVSSQRNTAALFGSGAIDSVSEEALNELVKAQAADGHVSGRVARLKDGRVGRFGWMATMATPLHQQVLRGRVVLAFRV